MRSLLLSAFVSAGCGGASSTPPSTPAPVYEAPPAPATQRAPKREAGRDCLVVREPGDASGAARESEVEGTLEAKDGAFVLQLAKPRCVTGLKGAGVVVEIMLASTGFDLRPFVGQRIRAYGEAAAAENSLGGATLVVLTSRVERLPRAERDGP